MVSSRVPKASGRLDSGTWTSHPGSGRGQHRHVTHELDDVAEAFSRANKDRLARDRLRAEPFRLGQIRIVVAARERGHPKARFLSLPAGLEVAEQKLQKSKIPLRDGMPLISGDRLAIRLNR